MRYGFFVSVTAPAAAPSAASAPKTPFPGPGAAQVGAPVRAPSAVAAPLRVGPKINFTFVRHTPYKTHYCS
jgi:hypothetical protein